MYCQHFFQMHLLRVCFCAYAQRLLIYMEGRTEPNACLRIHCLLVHTYGDQRKTERSFSVNNLQSGMFEVFAPVIIRVEVKKCEQTPVYSQTHALHVTRGQRSLRIAPSFLPHLHSCPATSKVCACFGHRY